MKEEILKKQKNREEKKENDDQFILKLQNEKEMGYLKWMCSQDMGEYEKIIQKRDQWIQKNPDLWEIAKEYQDLVCCLEGCGKQ